MHPEHPVETSAKLVITLGQVGYNSVTINECLLLLTFSQWSFGVTCWEVFSGGRIPYPAVDVMSILQLHEKGTRLEKPANAACTPEE